MTLRSSLARFQPESRPDAAELFALRREAWRRQGIVVLTPADIGDDWTRQAVINEATRLYGQREGGR